MTTSEPLIVGPAPLERWQSALELVLSQRVAAERTKLIWWLLHSPLRERLAGLFEARLGDRMVGAGLALPMPGKTALVYQPRLSWGAPTAAAGMLQKAMDQYLLAAGVLLAQEVLPVEASLDAAQARQYGFDIETTLLYYARTLDDCQEVSGAVLTVQPCHEPDRQRLERLIERTYLGTLDCPELNGVRSAFDVVEGYLEDRAWDEHCWRFLVKDGQDMGCVLLTPRPPNLCELVYLGLVPEARGKGLGRLAIQHALWLAKQSGGEEITVAVDLRNTPACRTYEGPGLREFDRRRVLLRVMHALPQENER